MAKDAGTRRERGSIRKRGNSLQVLVYAGLDPLTGQEAVPLRVDNRRGGGEADPQPLPG